MIALLTLLAALAGAAAPDGLELMRRAGEPPRQAYAALVAVSEARGKVKERLVSVSAWPSGRVTREVSGPSGTVERVIAVDGDLEWVCWPAKKTCRRRALPDPLARRFAPDEELDRAAENYAVSVSTAAPLLGRKTWLVEVRWKTDGALRRRLWLDRERGLVLKAQRYGPDGQALSTMELRTLERPAAAQPPRFSPPQGYRVLEGVEPEFLELEEARASSGLDPRAAQWVPPGFVLESVDVLKPGSKPVIHYRYSDGLSVLSLFQAPPRTRLSFKGRTRENVKVAGAQRATATRAAEGLVLAWSRRGHRFVLVGEAGLETLRKVAESVP